MAIMMTRDKGSRYAEPDDAPIEIDDSGMTMEDVNQSGLLSHEKTQTGKQFIISTHTPSLLILY